MNEELETKVPDAWPTPEVVDSNPIPPQHAGVAMPSTPQGVPATPGNLAEFELPFELSQQGWRKFWSKRENRPYFWNKLTGESLWEMPVVKPQFDPITDPLGICAPGPPAGKCFYK